MQVPETITGEYVLEILRSRKKRQTDLARILKTNKKVLWYQLHHGTITGIWELKIKQYLRRLSNRNSQKVLTK